MTNIAICQLFTSSVSGQNLSSFSRVEFTSNKLSDICWSVRSGSVIRSCNRYKSNFANVCGSITSANAFASGESRSTSMTPDSSTGRKPRLPLAASASYLDLP